jgi:hypothetical protein
MSDGSQIIARIAEAVIADDISKASHIGTSEWPFEKTVIHARNYSPKQLMPIFIRDGFCDRYSGTRLVHPGMLRLLSVILPDEFPFQKNWKMTETHYVFWKLFPTLDHVVPISRGGTDEASNWATTSQLRNSAKSNWTLDELGWELLALENLERWDGLSSHFIQLVEGNRRFLEIPYIRRWYLATRNSL